MSNDPQDSVTDENEWLKVMMSDWVKAHERDMDQDVMPLPDDAIEIAKIALYHFW